MLFRFFIVSVLIFTTIGYSKVLNIPVYLGIGSSKQKYVPYEQILGWTKQTQDTEEECISQLNMWSKKVKTISFTVEDESSGGYKTEYPFFEALKLKRYKVAQWFLNQNVDVHVCVNVKKYFSSYQQCIYHLVTDELMKNAPELTNSIIGKLNKKEINLLISSNFEGRNLSSTNWKIIEKLSKKHEIDYEGIIATRSVSYSLRYPRYKTSEEEWKKLFMIYKQSVQYKDGYFLANVSSHSDIKASIVIAELETNLNYQNNKLKPPVYYAVEPFNEGKKLYLETLIKKGVKIDTNTPVPNLKVENTSVIKYFLKNKISVNKVINKIVVYNRAGDRGLKNIYYDKNDFENILKLLEEFHYTYNVEDILNQFFSLDYEEMKKNYGKKATKRFFNDIEAKLNVLISMDINVNATNNEKLSILHWASKHNRYNLVDQLINRGADVTLVDNKGFTALDYAIENKNNKIVSLIKGGRSGKMTGLDKLLSKRKAKPDYKSYALVIGINQYSDVPQVEYANNSAKSFELAATNILGIPKENIITLIDSQATSGKIKSAILMISELVEKGDKIYFFYAGHGVPSIKGNAYLLPQDMKADNIEVEPTLMLSNVYKRLSDSEAGHVYVFIDSCFSGKDDSGDLLYKGVAPIMKTRKNKTSKKISIFTAGRASDFSNQYIEQEQRMFSYFTIRGILEGKRTAEELNHYIKTNVKRNSIKLGLAYKQIPQYEGSLDEKIY